MINVKHIVHKLLILAIIMTIVVAPLTQNTQPVQADEEEQAYPIRILWNPSTYVDVVYDEEDDEYIAELLGFNDYQHLKSTEEVYNKIINAINEGLNKTREEYVSGFDNHYPYAEPEYIGYPLPTKEYYINIITTSKIFIYIVGLTNLECYQQGFKDGGNTLVYTIKSYFLASSTQEKIYGDEIGEYDLSSSVPPDNTGVRLVILLSPHSAIINESEWIKYLSYETGKNIEIFPNRTLAVGFKDVDYVIACDIYPIADYGVGPSKFIAPFYNNIGAYFVFDYSYARSALIWFLYHFMHKISIYNSVEDSFELAKYELSHPIPGFEYYLLFKDESFNVLSSDRIVLLKHVDGEHYIIIEPDNQDDEDGNYGDGDDGDGNDDILPPGCPTCPIPLSIRDEKYIDTSDR